MERWIRTLKAECLYLHDFAALAEARHMIGEFIARHNTQLMLERHDYRTPIDVRRAFTVAAA